MSKFQGSLQDWRGYIDEKTKAVRDQKMGRSAVDDADLDEPPAGPPAPAVDADHPVSDEVEAVLAKHRAIADEINRADAPPAPPAPTAPIIPPIVTAPAPSVEPNVAEAAAMFARLPRHIQLLMRPSSDEVAQNSYKNKFTETREELIMRLLDPQLSLEETARVLNVCPTTVRRYTNRGLLRQERTQGNHRRFRLSNVLEFLDKYSAEDA